MARFIALIEIKRIRVYDVREQFVYITIILFVLHNITCSRVYIVYKYYIKLYILNIYKIYKILVRTMSYDIISKTGNLSNIL